MASSLMASLFILDSHPLLQFTYPSYIHSEAKVTIELQFIH